MRCCVPFCRSTAANVRTAEGRRKDEGITFHGFPSEACLRAAWLRALSKQDTDLPDSAVVCSQHFLSDDFSETESGSRQIAPGAIPSTVLVCTMCLDSDSKQLPMSKYKLDEAYQQFIGLPLCDRGNLQQTLCVRCAHRLINVTRFRDDSLRTRSLMKGLVEKNELITNLHIKLITRDQNLVKSKFVITTIAPDYCDLHIVEEHYEEQTESEETESGDEKFVKNEDSLDSMFADGDLGVKNEFYESNGPDDSKAWRPRLLDEVLQQEQAALKSTVACLTRIQDPLMFADETVTCALCLGEFVSEQEFSEHMTMHRQTSDVDSECVTSQVCEPAAAASSGWHSAPLIEHKLMYCSSDADSECVTSQVCEPAAAASSGWHSAPLSEHKHAVQSLDDDSPPPTDLALPSGIPLHVIAAPNEDDLLKKSGKGLLNDSELNKSDSSNKSTDINISTHEVKLNNILKEHDPIVSVPATSENDVTTTFKKHDKMPYSCKHCEYTSKWKGHIVVHMRRHTGEKPFSCEICDFKGIQKSSLARHMRTHIGKKIFSCNHCEYTSNWKGNISVHMRRHTGEKPFSCEFCDFKGFQKSSLERHMRTHIGEKTFSCKLCKYKCTAESKLMVHNIRKHTVDKLYTCEICNYKCLHNSTLVTHMKAHMGDKPFLCHSCEYRCVSKSNLIVHMRTHTGEKPYSCKLCEYKCTKTDHLVVHMRTHTGEKPYACNICDFKCTTRGSLRGHIRTHTREKPYSCNLCKYKCATASTLVGHMRTHTGEKPYACDMCKFRCSAKASLVGHMRAHTVENAYCCNFCEFRSNYKRGLGVHMQQSHAGEKRFFCKLCDYKSDKKSYLKKHMEKNH